MAFTSPNTVAAGDALTASMYNTYVRDNTNAFRNNSGVVPPAARILMTQAFTVANSSHTSFAGFTSSNASEDFDTDLMVSLSATPSCMTIKTAGIYQVNATVNFPSGTSSIRFARIVRSRDSTLTPLAVEEITTGSAVQFSLAACASFVVGDLIRLMVYQNSGAAMALIASNGEFSQIQVSAFMIGATS